MSYPRIKLGMLARFVNGKAFKPSDWSTCGTPIIRIQNLNNSDRLYNYWAGPLDRQVQVKKGDLLLAWSGTPGTSFGAFIWSGTDAVLNQHIFRVDLDTNQITITWAKFVINFQLERLIDLAHGGVGLKHVTRGMVEELEVPVPALAEQRRIAEVLDGAEALRTKRRAALTQLDTFTQSLFHEFFNNTKNQHYKCAMDYLAESNRGSFVNGPFGSDLLTSELQDNGVPVIYIRDIREGEYRRVSTVCVSERKAKDLDVCTVRPGDVLIAKVGDPPGIAAIYPQNEPAAIVTQDVIRIRLNTDVALPEYIVGYLNSSIGRWKVSGITIEATRARFSLGDLKRLKIELPPIHLQYAFANQVSEVKKLKTTYRKSLVELDALFASLQHRAFRGEL